METVILKRTLYAVFIVAPVVSFAQCKEATWPQDTTLRAKAQESKVLYEDALKSGAIKAAEAPLNWLLANAPELHSSIYILGAEVFDKLAAQEKDTARKKIYVDSLMIVYDMRIKHCGEEASVTNRKALSFVKYKVYEQPDVALELLERALQLNGNNTLDGTMVPYFQTVKINVLKFKNMTDDQILEKYDNVMNIIDSKIRTAQSKGQPIAKYSKMKDDIDVILMSIVKVDCAFVKKNLEPKFRQNPDDLVLAKKIFGFMLQGKCTDDPLWLEAGESIHRNNPVKDLGLAKNLGLKYYSIDNFAKAENYLKEALPLASNGAEKAEVLIYLGQLEGKNNKPAARALYRQALEADPGTKLAYERIGDLYYHSFDDCAKKVNQADDRLVYLIAADYFQKSGDAAKIAAAKALFPSKEEIFLIDYKQGETKSVGCWIGESTTIRTRD
jgi:tetratricopeptide (TPR) repeat protein